MSKTRVLITGALGYIGGVMMDVLEDYGYETWGLDLKTEPKGCGNPRYECSYERFFADTDCRNLQQMDFVLDLCKSEYIVHCAGLIQVGESAKKPFEYWDHNLIGTMRVLQAARGRGVKGIVFISSAAVYGDQTGVMTINSPTIPTSVYGQTKLAAEHLVERAGIPYVIFRLFNVAGATEKRFENHEVETHLIPLMLRAAKTGKPIEIFGNTYDTSDGTCIRDYVHVGDVAYAAARAIHTVLPFVSDDPERNRHFNLGLGIGATVMEVHRMVQKVTGLRVPIIIGDRREGDPAVLVADPLTVRDLMPRPSQYDTLEKIIQSQWKHMC